MNIKNEFFVSKKNKNITLELITSCQHMSQNEYCLELPFLYFSKPIFLKQYSLYYISPYHNTNNQKISIHLPKIVQVIYKKKSIKENNKKQMKNIHENS